MHVTSRVVKNKTISRDRQTAGQKPHITAITWNLTLWSYTHEYIYIPSSSSTWIFVQAKAAHPPNLRTHCRNISLLCSLENWKFLYSLHEYDEPNHPQSTQLSLPHFHVMWVLQELLRWIMNQKSTESNFTRRICRFAIWWIRRARMCLRGLYFVRAVTASLSFRNRRA